MIKPIPYVQIHRGHIQYGYNMEGINVMILSTNIHKRLSGKLNTKCWPSINQKIMSPLCDLSHQNPVLKNDLVRKKKLTVKY